jgi:hypothetical protein
MSDLTAEEKEVFELLGSAWNKFLKLPDLAQWDGQEFMHFIHGAQNIILARVIMRIWRERELGDS